MFWNTSACLAQLGRISRPLVSTFVTHAQSVHPQILWGLQISPIVKVRYIIRDAFLFICFKFRALSYRTNYCSTLWLLANASSFYTLYIKYLIGIKLHWPAWMIIFSRLLFIFFLVFFMYQNNNHFIAQWGLISLISDRKVSTKNLDKQSNTILFWINWHLAHVQRIYRSSF